MLAKNKLNSVLFAHMHVLIFDSGVGGLSVVAELRKLMPDMYMTYVADDEFRPYGEKTETQLKSRLPGLLKTLVMTTKPDAVVIACNTASTTALDEIRAALDVPVIGVVPAIKPAARMSKTKFIAVLGTPGTVKRAYVDDLIADFAHDCDITLVGSTKLVDMAERKLAGGQVDMDIVKDEIALIFAQLHKDTPHKDISNKEDGSNKEDAQDKAKIDVVVLACTHFPLLIAELERAAPHKVTWVDSGTAIARRTQLLLERARPLKCAEKNKLENLQQNTALLVGPEVSAARRKAFAAFGFERVIALKP